MWYDDQRQDRHHEQHLSHDLPCFQCGHAAHTFLPCGDDCDCPRSIMPGSVLATAA